MDILVDNTYQNTMELHNTYYFLRHGRSSANEADVIVSQLENGVHPKWGLTDTGVQQATAAGQKLREQLPHSSAADVLIYASPFSRTVETARAVAAALGWADADIQVAPELRERGFGDYELQPTSNYGLVWAADAASPATRPPGEGGESVEDVAQRTHAFIQRLEQQHYGKSILLVSHGDALSILAARMLGTALSQHRQHGLPNCGILQVPPAIAGQQ